MPRKKNPKTFKRGTNWATVKHSNDDVIRIEDGDEVTYGQACNRLRKSWKKLKIAKSTDDGISLDEAKESINKIKRAMGLPETDFENYEKGVTDTWSDQD